MCVWVGVTTMPHVTEGGIFREPIHDCVTPPAWKSHHQGGNSMETAVYMENRKRVRVCFDSRKIVEILEYVRVGFVSITRQIFGTDCVLPRSWQLKVVESTH